MRYLAAIGFFLFMSCFVQAQCDKIYFVEAPMDFAYTKAKEENKRVFVFLHELGERKADFFQSAIFYKQEICSVFNNYFINIKAKKDSKTGHELISQYQIDTFPCFLILDQYGRVISQTSSINSTKELLDLAYGRNQTK